MTRPIFLGVKLSEAESEALGILADREGLNKSVVMRRIFRMALHEFPTSIFPPTIAASLNLTKVEPPNA